MENIRLSSFFAYLYFTNGMFSRERRDGDRASVTQSTAGVGERTGGTGTRVGAARWVRRRRDARARIPARHWLQTSPTRIPASNLKIRAVRKRDRL